VVELVALLTLAVGSTTVSPACNPLSICVVEVPIRPVVTDVTVRVPSFASTVTVERLPTVVMAALGSSSTPVAVCTTTLTSVVIPSLTSDGMFSKAMVTGYSTTLLETVAVGAIAVT